MCQYANCLRCVPHGNWYADNYSPLKPFAQPFYPTVTTYNVVILSNRFFQIPDPFILSLHCCLYFVYQRIYFLLQLNFLFFQWFFVKFGGTSSIVNK